MKAFLTTWGLYQADKTIFDKFHIPTALNKDQLVNYILTETMELETLYPAPEWFSHVLDVWSAVKLPYWEELEKTLHYEYNPIHNYDRKEELTDADSGTSSGTGSSSGNSTNDSTNNNTDSTIQKATAFNSDTPKETGRAENSGQSAGNVKANYTTGTNSSEQYQKTLKRTMHTSGNIGVTTTQQMIQAQREIVRFSVYDAILQDFKGSFCVQVY